MNYRLYNYALELEEENPGKALEIYEKIEKENRELHLSILLAGISFPILAYLTTLFAMKYITDYQVIVTLLILVMIGYIPSFLIYTIKFDKKEKGYFKASPREITGILAAGLVTGILEIIGDQIELAIMAVWALIPALAIEILIMLTIHFLTGTPLLETLPIPIIGAIGLTCFIIIFLVHMSEVALKSGFNYNPLMYLLAYTLEFIYPTESTRLGLIKEMASDILAGLKVHLDEVIGYLASMAIGLVLVGSGPLEIFYEDIRQGILANTIAGSLFALSLTGRLEKDPILANLSRLGKIRCLIRLGKETEAAHQLSKLDWHLRTTSQTPIKHTTSALTSLLQESPSLAREYLYEAAKTTSSLKTDTTHKKLIQQTIQKTTQLINTQ